MASRKRKGRDSMQQAKKKDQKRMYRIQKREASVTLERTRAIYDRYIRPTLPVNHVWEYHDVPQNFSLEKFTSRMPMVLVEHPLLEQAGQILPVLLLTIVPLPCDVCSLIGQYNPCGLAFDLYKNRNQIITAWMKFLQCETKPFDKRWGGILLGEKFAVVFTHSPRACMFSVDYYELLETNKVRKRTEEKWEWLFRYSHAQITQVIGRLSMVTSETTETENLSDKVVCRAFPCKLKLLPLLLDAPTLSPLSIVYKRKNLVVNVK